MDERHLHLLVLCTGNAARSVMAGYMLCRLAETERIMLDVTTAGTHAIDGQPMSLRTRGALAAIPELADAPASRHRSHQLVAADLEDIDLAVAMEADHVRFVRRHHPAAAARTATLRRACRDLPSGEVPLSQRVASLGLDTVVLGEDEDVPDPAGHEEEVYVACAHELWRLSTELVRRL